MRICTSQTQAFLSFSFILSSQIFLIILLIIFNLRINRVIPLHIIFKKFPLSLTSLRKRVPKIRIINIHTIQSFKSRISIYHQPILRYNSTFAFFSDIQVRSGKILISYHVLLRRGIFFIVVFRVRASWVEICDLIWLFFSWWRLKIVSSIYKPLKQKQ